MVKKNLDEQVSWQGFGTGEVDAVVENWGHEDLVKKYITEQKVAVDLGPTGNIGKIGWYVPPWLAKAHPDITDWKNLNKYAADVQDVGVGRQGPAAGRRPGVRHQRRRAGEEPEAELQGGLRRQEAALITAFRQAEKNKKPVIGYFYEPQWFLSEVPLVKVNLPPYKPGCDADAAKVACDYPLYNLNKVVSTKFASSGQPGVRRW